MKQITPDLYVIEPGLYAERRGGQWFTSNEASEILTGPFGSLEALEDDEHRVDTVTVLKPPVDDDPGDLMTLRQAAKRLPVSPQALYALRSRGGLPDPRRVFKTPATRTGFVELYSLADLAALYEKTRAERISEGARRAWAKLTPEQRAERYAKGRNR